jgi:hypothetical protein
MRATATLFLVLAGLVGIWPSTSWGDSWLPPKPRIFAASTGDFGLKVIPDQPLVKSAATLFTLDSDGKEQVVWQGGMVNIPYQVFVSFTGHVITVDTYANLGYEHSLVVYGPTGKVLGDYKLEELLTAQEIAQKVLMTASSRWWTSGAAFDFNLDGKTFLIKLNWGLVIKVDLTTGRVDR